MTGGGGFGGWLRHDGDIRAADRRTQELESGRERQARQLPADDLLDDQQGLDDVARVERLADQRVAMLVGQLRVLGRAGGIEDADPAAVRQPCDDRLVTSDLGRNSSIPALFLA